MEKYLDDRYVIPEDIKNMTKEELELEIIKLEKENNNPIRTEMI